MKKLLIAIVLLFSINRTAMAYGYYYDSVDAMADMEQAQISAQERAEVMHELREGDFVDAERVIQRDEAIKSQIRQNEYMYDSIRDSGGYGYGFNFYGGY
jgi:hypothetical protein